MKKPNETVKDNGNLAGAIKKFSRQKQGIWQKVAYELAKPRRKKIEINISKIARFVNDGDVILVPGKVLGSGELGKKITIAAFSFSESAKMLIGKAGGKTTTLEKLMEENPSGKGIVLLK